MTRVSIPKTELCRLLGLDPNSDDATIQRALDEFAASQRAREIEARERAEDRQLVEAAVCDGRINPRRRGFWIEALARDRDANRAVLASLAPGLPADQNQTGPDAELERVHVRVLSRLGLNETAPRTVAAAQNPTASKSARSALVDDLGIPVEPVPQPVRISRGKNPADWSTEEQYSWFAHRLGARFREGVPPPPKTDSYYQPSPNDPYEWVENGDGTGEFRPKANYQPRI